MKEPLIHSHCTDVLPEDHPRAFIDIECTQCKQLVHADNNECMQTWVETGLGPYCLQCFAHLNIGGVSDAYWLPGSPDIRKARNIPEWP